MKKFFKAALLTLAIALAAPSLGLAKEELTITGSTTVLPIMQKTVEAYMKSNPDAVITVSGGGSGNGIKAIIDNTAGMAMSSRNVKEAEVDTAQSKNVKLNLIPIAIEAVVPIVNPANKVDNLSREQLKQIFAGEITNWKEVGGADKPIVLISRDTSSGTYETWDELIMKKTKVAPSALLQPSSGAVLQIVAKNKYAIGYESYGYVNQSVKALKVDGVAGSPKSAVDGSYSLTRKLYLLTNGEPKGLAGALVKFVESPEGSKIISEEGAVPLK